MSENFDEILSAALSMSPGTDAMLAGHLLKSLDDENQKPQTEQEYTLEELLAGVTNANLVWRSEFWSLRGKRGLVMPCFPDWNYHAC